jgi:hypothetical protein
MSTESLVKIGMLEKQLITSFHEQCAVGSAWRINICASGFKEFSINRIDSDKALSVLIANKF